MNHLLQRLLWALLGLAATAASSAATDDLLASDRAFAARAAEVGYHAAFIEFLAEDAVLFRPEAVRGQEWLATHEPAGGRLAWQPAAAAMSCSAAFGVTTGPWRYSNDEGGEPVEGHYISVWRPDGNGQWRVVLDHGIDHVAAPAPPSLAEAVRRLWPDQRVGHCTGHGEQEDLLRAETELNADIGRRGLGEALRATAAEGALAYRDDLPPGPLAGVDPNVDARFGAGTVPQAVGIEFDPGGDLAVTHGLMRTADGSGRALYVRVWSRERRQWRVAIDLQTPLAQQ